MNILDKSLITKKNEIILENNLLKNQINSVVRFIKSALSKINTNNKLVGDQNINMNFAVNMNYLNNKTYNETTKLDNHLRKDKDITIKDYGIDFLTRKPSKNQLNNTKPNQLNKNFTLSDLRQKRNLSENFNKLENKNTSSFLNNSNLSGNSQNNRTKSLNSNYKKQITKKLILLKNDIEKQKTKLNSYVQFNGLSDKENLVKEKKRKLNELLDENLYLEEICSQVKQDFQIEEEQELVSKKTEELVELKRENNKLKLKLRTLEAHISKITLEEVVLENKVSNLEKVIKTEISSQMSQEIKNLENAVKNEYNALLKKMEKVRYEQQKQNEMKTTQLKSLENDTKNINQLVVNQERQIALYEKILKQNIKRTNIITKSKSKENNTIVKEKYSIEPNYEKNFDQLKNKSSSKYYLATNLDKLKKSNLSQSITKSRNLNQSDPKIDKSVILNNYPDTSHKFNITEYKYRKINVSKGETDYPNFKNEFVKTNININIPSKMMYQNTFITTKSPKKFKSDFDFDFDINENLDYLILPSSDDDVDVKRIFNDYNSKLIKPLNFQGSKSQINNNNNINDLNTDTKFKKIEDISKFFYKENLINKKIREIEKA